MSRGFLIAGVGGATAVTAGATQPVGILDATLWTVTINGQQSLVTGQSLVVIASAIVGIGALIVSIIKLYRS